MEPQGVWIIAEQADSRVRRISYELLTRARALAALQRAAALDPQNQSYQQVLQRITAEDIRP